MDSVMDMNVTTSLLSIVYFIGSSISTQCWQYLKQGSAWTTPKEKYDRKMRLEAAESRSKKKRKKQINYTRPVDEELGLNYPY